MSNIQIIAVRLGRIYRAIYYISFFFLVFSFSERSFGEKFDHIHSVTCREEVPCGAAIQRAIDSIPEQKSQMLTLLSSSTKTHKRILLTRAILLRSGLTIVSSEGVVLEVSGSTVFRVENGDEIESVSITGLVVRKNECLSRWRFLEIPSNTTFINVKLSEIDLDVRTRSEAAHSACAFVSIHGAGKGLNIIKNKVEGVGRFLLVSNSGKNYNGVVRDIRVLGNMISRIGHSGIYLGCSCENVLIKNNTFFHHHATARASHFIATYRTQFESGQRTRNLSIIQNSLIGLPDVAHYKEMKVNGDGYSQRISAANGAAADMVALRGVHGFVIRGNTLLNGGEAGITLSDDSKRGVVAQNLLQKIDTVGIVVGVRNRGKFAPVSDIEVCENHLLQYALNRPDDSKNSVEDTDSAWDGRLEKGSRVGIRITNAKNITVARNILETNTKSVAIGVHDRAANHTFNSISPIGIDIYGNILGGISLGSVMEIRYDGSRPRNWSPISPGSVGGVYWRASHGSMLCASNLGAE